MRAEVIAIGDELMSGQRTDTNSAWLSQRLTEMGIRVRFHTTVGDDAEASTAVFRSAIKRADVVVSTGGLGPTADDLTRQALAAATGRPLEKHEAALRHIRHMFQRLGREMPPSNAIQAMFPQGSRVIANPHGTAPGIDVETSQAEGGASRFFALPGVPAEMRQMWNETVGPALRSIGAQQRTIQQHRIKCFGAGESEIERKLPDLIRRGREPSVGITASKATITLRVTAEGDNVEACHEAMRPTIETIQQCLGPLVFGEEDDELQHVVVRQLRRHRVTLSTAEWGTHGLLNYWLGTTPEWPDVYRGGIVVNSWNSLSALLGGGVSVPRGSEPTADFVRAAASRLRDMMDTDFALVVGPQSEDGDSAATPGTVPIALATREKTDLVRTPFIGHPDIRLERCAKHALNLLRLRLLHFE